MSTPSSEYFDAWYADMVGSQRHDEIVRATLGLPAELESTSLLPWDGIAEVVNALALSTGDVLVDLGCGRGGYGLEVAQRTGASLIGVDFSGVAVERARERSAQSWPEVTADFRVGELAATGLADSSAAAIMCVDAMQFADPYAAGLTECARVLVPGGRLALTGWQARDPDDGDVPERLRRNIGAELVAAGFGDVVVREREDWQQAERAMWQAALAAEADDDPAMQSMRDEGSRVLAWIDRVRRVLVTARAGQPDP